MKHVFSLICFFLLVFSPTIYGQYQFDTTSDLACTSVKSQGRTGTCWSFTTISYLESEMLRQGKVAEDLSEMYVVRSTYLDKAKNYFLRQGKANFSQGSLSHDVMKAFSRDGIVPDAVFSGLKDGAKRHDHNQLERELKSFLDKKIASKTPMVNWIPEFTALLDDYLGEAPTEFGADDGTYTPQTYAKTLGINPDDYVTLTSFTHHPYFSSFILEIPDNYSNGLYYNLPLKDLESILIDALESGHTVAWDGDVSEPTFSSAKGLAVLPEDPSADWTGAPVKEISVNADNRQKAFEDYTTTDDHLMHLVGLSKDQAGNTYIKVKNSWGAVGPYNGFLYMSLPYYKMKTVGILVHKDVIPEEIKQQLGLN
ncbi:MAG: C1 family peptidase [Saprospiraceae bacterium]